MAPSPTRSRRRHGLALALLCWTIPLAWLVLMLSITLTRLPQEEQILNSLRPTLDPDAPLEVYPTRDPACWSGGGASSSGSCGGGQSLSMVVSCRCSSKREARSAHALADAYTGGELGSLSTDGSQKP